MAKRKPKVEASTTHLIPCAGKCGKKIRVDKAIKEALCWKCTSEKIQEKVEERKVKEKGRKRRTTGKRKPRASAGTSDHMSPDSIRARFDEAQGDRKLGFFQEVFLLIKTKKKMQLEELASAAYSLKSKPERYDKVDKIKKQLRYYCKSIWGKKSNLVQLTGNTVTYKG